MAFPVHVPRVAGVPAVDFASYAGQIISLLTSDAIGIFSGAVFPQRWGLYSGGAAIVVADNVLTFDYRQQWALSDYPVERGAFETYDKVQVPFDARFRFSAGGSSANRQALLDSIAAVAGSLQLFDVVTPEAVYTNVNITHYDYSRAAQTGAGLISVDVWALEVRETNVGIMQSTQDPSSASQVNGGTVQPGAATTAQASKIDAIRDHSAGGHLAE